MNDMLLGYTAISKNLSKNIKYVDQSIIIDRLDKHDRTPVAMPAPNGVVEKRDQHNAPVYKTTPIHRRRSGGGSQREEREDEDQEEVQNREDVHNNAVFTHTPFRGGQRLASPFFNDDT